MKVYGLLPCLYSPSSNGIITLCQLYQEIQARLTAYFRFLVCYKDAKQLVFYKEMFGASLLAYKAEERPSIAQAIASEQFAMIRPDDLEGIANPVHWQLARNPNLAFTLNLLLAPPFVFSRARSILDYYTSKDYFLVGNQSIMPAFSELQHRDCFFEVQAQCDRRFVTTLSRQRSGVAVYIGKGVAGHLHGLEDFLKAKSLAKGSADFRYISRRWPSTRAKLREVLSASSLLISFDPFSHIEREATLLGVPVLKPNSLNLRELPGVYKTIDEISSIESADLGREIQELAWRDYDFNRARNDLSLSRICAALEALLSSGKQADLGVAIPYSHRAIYAFGSQLRAYLPLIGQVHLDSIVGEIGADDVAQILLGAPKSAMAVKYEREAQRLITPWRIGSRFSEEARNKALSICKYRDR